MPQAGHRITVTWAMRVVGGLCGWRIGGGVVRGFAKYSAETGKTLAALGVGIGWLRGIGERLGVQPVEISHRSKARS
jgi:hypothetical protein